MKITKLEIFPVAMAYSQPYEQATGVTSVAKKVIIKIYTDENIVGVGEASTVLTGRTGESAETITVALAQHLGPLLLGEDPFQIQQIWHKLRRASQDQYCFLYSKTAIDIALHDIVGKALNVPVAVLLGGIVRTRIGVSRSVPLATPKEVGQAAAKLARAGYRAITIKAGVDPALDLKRVAAVRRAVGGRFPIEVDANQGYRADIAVQICSRMEEDYQVLNFEQPCPWWDLSGMAEVARQLKATVVADESVFTPPDAMNVVLQKAADALTIKLAKNGGFLQAKRIAAIAGAAGLACNMGSDHPAGVGTAAMAHLWASTPEIVDYVGYGSPLERFKDDIIKEPIRFKDGFVYFPEGPGLGVELDEKKLRKFAAPIKVE